MVGACVAELFHPGEGAGGIDDDVVLAGVYKHFGVERGKDVLDETCLIFHEIFIEGLPDITTLRIEFDIFVPFVHIENLL